MHLGEPPRSASYAALGLEALSDSVHARLGTAEHLRRQQARRDRPHHPAPRRGPEGLAAGRAAEALVAAP